MSTMDDERDRAAEEVEAAVNELEAIANLPSALDDAFPFFERQRDYRVFWQRQKEVMALFRAKRLRREDNERLWARQSALCAQMKEIQTREREARYNESQRNKEQILFVLRDAPIGRKVRRRLRTFTKYAPDSAMRWT